MSILYKRSIINKVFLTVYLFNDMNLPLMVDF